MDRIGFAGGSQNIGGPQGITPRQQIGQKDPVKKEESKTSFPQESFTKSSTQPQAEFKPTTFSPTQAKNLARSLSSKEGTQERSKVDSKESFSASPDLQDEPEMVGPGETAFEKFFLAGKMGDPTQFFAGAFELNGPSSIGKDGFKGVNEQMAGPEYEGNPSFMLMEE